jgi:A118 family predicted phage portal protein
MFLQRVIEWIKGVLKMLKSSDVKSTFGVEPVISQAMANALTLWTEIYENRAHWLNGEVKSMGLAAAISGEVSRAVTIEMEVALSGGARADYIAEQIAAFIDDIRKNSEYALAKGGMIFKPYPSGDNIFIDAIQADHFYPVSFDGNGKIAACVFMYQLVKGDTYFTRLEFHRLTDEGLQVINTAYRSKSKDTLGTKVNLTDVEEWADIEPESLIQNVDRPLWGYFKPPIANNIDLASPLGVSVFARAVGLIEEADKIYSNFLWELESGERALYVEKDAFGKDADGKAKLPKRRLYRFADLQASIEKPGLFHDYTPAIRQADLLASLDAQLKRIELVCGLAQGTISDPATVALTATEIKMSKQRTYALIVDTQKALQNALDDLLYALNVWADIQGAPRGTYSVMYQWDDSVVSDHEAQFMEDSQAVNMSVMPKQVFLERNYKLDEATAKKWLAMLDAETQPTEFFPADE